MYEFIYHMKFKVTGDALDIKIFLSLEDLFTPVYIRAFDKSVLENREQFFAIYQEFSEYLIKKNIVINEEDLRLLSNVLISFNLTLPDISSIDINKYDDELDSYGHILTPKEIVFLKYADGKAIDDKRFKSWEDENNQDTMYLRNLMVNKKLLSTDNYYFNLVKAKRELLLEVVELYGLDIHGDNGDLIDMIKQELPEAIIEKHFKGTHYTLTEKGKKIIEKSRKLIDFDRSFFRYVNRLPLEEFHLLSIKKPDYDFNGIGRLLMVNGNGEVNKSFDWNTLKASVDVIKEEEENKVQDLEIDEYINRINVKYNTDEEEKTDVFDDIDDIKEENDEEHVTIEDIFIEDPIVKQKLENYRLKREMFIENNNKIEKNTYHPKVNKKRKKFKFLNWILVIVIIIAFITGLLYLNEEFSIVKLPFTLREIIKSLEKAFKHFWDKIEEFFNYLKKAINKILK